MAGNDPPQGLPPDLEPYTEHAISSPHQENQEAIDGLKTQEAAARENESPMVHSQGWRVVVQHLGPSWFSVPMGTGITGLLLAFIPWEAKWLYWLSVIFLCMNTAIFVVVLMMNVLRYFLYPQTVIDTFTNSADCLALGGMPIALATIIEFWLFLCVPYWGYWAAIFGWILWMIDTILSCVITLGVLYVLVSRPHLQDLTGFSAPRVLPIAATVVASGVAAEAARFLSNADHAIGTLITGYVLWSLSVPLAIFTFVVYYHRLILHNFPAPQAIVTCFIPLGPLGMGGFAIMYLGRVSSEVLSNVWLLHDVPLAGDFLYIFGIVTAMIMWGFGLVWLTLAVAACLEATPFSFNMSWWSFTFPLAVYSLSTMTLGVELSSKFFKVLGTIFTVAEVLLWMVTFAKTAQKVWRRQLP